MVHNGHTINRLRKEKNIGTSMLAKMIGEKAQSLTTLYKTKTVNQERLQRVADALQVSVDDLNADFDETELTNETQFPIQDADSIHADSQRNNKGGLPLNKFSPSIEVELVGKDAYSGYLANWREPKFISSLPHLTLTMIKDYEKDANFRAFEVGDNRMDCDRKYAIEKGSIVVGINIPREQWSSKLPIKQHRAWVVVYDEGIIIAHILNHDIEKRVITCRFYNEDKSIYPDLEIELEAVFELYSIVHIGKDE